MGYQPVIDLMHHVPVFAAGLIGNSALVVLNLKPESLLYMDTDDLTEMAYQTIILADEATDVLKCELGILSGKYQTEDEYLARVLEYVAALSKEPEEFLDYWGLLDETHLPAFVGKLDKLRRHVEATLHTPYPKRGKPAF
jgi:hypothetical protein